MSIVDLTDAYEAWLRAELRKLHNKGVAVVKHDLKQKHRIMCEEKRFLRATYWRWAEKILKICPELKKTPAVLAVGDIHVENFGTWRDREGRLVWGVNDFDEAAEMPYALDLVRLATSAFIMASDALGTKTICDLVLSGYRSGLYAPKAIVLDQDAGWLYDKVRVNAKACEKFWQEFGIAADGASAPKADRKAGKPPPTFKRYLDAACPSDATALTYYPRTSGGGSLGRPRWVVVGESQGGAFVREAKVIVASAWTLQPGRNSHEPKPIEKIANGRYRSRDPYYRMMDDSILVRRLSPNNRKLDFEKDLPAALLPSVLKLMGQDLAAVHAGTTDEPQKITADLDARRLDWWDDAVAAAVQWVRSDHKDWTRAKSYCAQTEHGK